MAARMAPRFRELTDVDWASFEDGEVATYDSGTDSLTGEPGGGDAVADLATHAADTTNVHGIVDTTVLASDAELAAHIVDGTFVHGITNTADLATDAEVATAVSTHSSDTTSVHGITDTTVLATDAEVASAVATHESDTSVHGIADTTALATDAEVTAAVSAHESDTTVHGVDTANVPSSGEKAALAGTSGTPSVSNRFVTEDDPAVGAADLSAILDENGYVFTKKTSEPADGDLEVGEAVWWLDDTRYAPAFKIKALDGTVVSYTFDQMPNQNWLSEAGELFVGAVSGPDLYITILSPGTNDQVLTRDDTVEGVGLKWATPTGGVDQGDIDDTVATHSADTTSVHGIADTSALATASSVATAVSNHEADTTSVHGIADTSALATLPIAEANVTGLTAALAAKQPLDTDLTAIAALTSAADKLAYATGSGTWSLAELTAAGRALLDDADAAAQLTTLGVSTFVKTLLDDADAATARTTLGVSSAPTIASLSNWWTFVPHASSSAEVGTTTGMIYVLGIFVPVSCTLTGIGALSGPTVNGTAKALVGLYDATGALVANSNLAGQVVTGASLFQKIPFTSTYPATGPALYFAAVQLDGTGTRLRHVNPADTAVGYLSALTKSVAGTFGTLPTITPPTGPTTSIGPVLVTY